MSIESHPSDKQNNPSHSLHSLYLVALLVLTSCATHNQESHPAPWPGAQVFKLPQEGGFQFETLELKDGRFRYWFSIDVALRHQPKYPIQGSYEWRGDNLVLSIGQSYVVHTLQGVRTLWKPTAVDYWDRHQIIDNYGILLPVGDIQSRVPTLQPLFTKEQWDRSGEQVKRLEDQK